MSRELKKVRLPIDGSGNPVQALHPDSANEQIITSTGASQLSASLQGVEVVRVWSDADCHIAFGDIGVVATATSLLLKANSPEYFSLRGDWYIAVFGASHVYVTPMN